MRTDWSCVIWISSGVWVLRHSSLNQLAGVSHSTHPACWKKTELFQPLEKQSEFFPTVGNRRTSTTKFFHPLEKYIRENSRRRRCGMFRKALFGRAEPKAIAKTDDWNLKAYLELPLHFKPHLIRCGFLRSKKAPSRSFGTVLSEIRRIYSSGSNISLSTPQSGQTQSAGRSANAVPAATPLSGSPTSGS